jgi:hypothetical protein
MFTYYRTMKKELIALDVFKMYFSLENDNIELS